MLKFLIKSVDSLGVHCTLEPSPMKLKPYNYLLNHDIVEGTIVANTLRTPVCGSSKR